MNDRVRIYELARRMNISNEDIITTLRELGYDIKSHSSTVDGNAVGLLIAALGKKKQQQQDKTKPVKATTTKTTSKAAPQAAPPPVKPRVLGRYPKKPTEPITGEAAGEVLPPVAPTTTSSPTLPQGAGGSGSATRPQGTPVSPPTNQLRPGTIPTTPASGQASGTQPQQPPRGGAPTTGGPSTPPGKTQEQQPAQPVEPPPPSPVLEEPVAEKLPAPVELEEEKEQEDFTPPSEPPKAPITPEQKANKPLEEQKKPEAEPPLAEEEQAEEDGNEPVAGFPAHGGQAVRPMTPSVPIRIAAPSIRATPPRPPKSHRQTPSERHGQKKEEKARPTAVTLEIPKEITLTSGLTVKDLAEKMSVSVEELIKRLMMKNIMRNVNQLVEVDLARELAAEMGYEVTTEAPQVKQTNKPEEILTEEEQAALVTRPPVVTIMGHVDHGKTSLLDAIRQTKFLLTDAEAGGITQHIGAYHVEVPYEDNGVTTMRQIVFLDTPGHEAFTAMRARGAKATDIAVLVVAADDGVMPQTIEAIDHAKAAGVQIIVAVNKIDKADSDPDRVLMQLMEHELVPERFGGRTITVPVSAKKRIGLDELLEMILIVSDMLDLKSNPDRPATGVIIEAELSRGKGAVATALVQAGTLREGDFIAAGSASGRVRALFDDRGQRVKAAGPSMPVEVLGLDEVPQAGDRFDVVEDIQSLKSIVEKRKLEAERRPSHVTLESLHDLLARGEVKDLNVIVKADVHGTAEAIAEQVKKLSSSEVQVRVLRAATGDISETDVSLAASSNALIIGFNVQPDQNASRVAEQAGVDVRTYSIIYQITDDLEKAIQGLIQPVKQEVQIGTAEIRQVFKFGKNLTIAGCMVLNGKIQRGAIAKIDRMGQIVYEGKVETLKRFKDDTKEVAQGFECGMSFEKFNEIQEGDKVNVFVIQETKR